ncbi:MAG: hypothetical protein L3K09_00390 [Thermoplasmata archaeon]|nr:hypothetical protein [Thermoplasmata archaeon]
MPARLHTGGRYRRWLGEHLAGDPELGDRLWRRLMHCAGALVLVYFLLPVGFFRVVSNEVVLFAALAVVLSLEGLRHVAHLEIPTVLPRERDKVASFAFYAIALVATVVLFDRPVATFAVIGAAFLDPVIGEMRRSARWRPAYPALPLAAYGAIAFAALLFVGRFSAPGAIVLAVPAAVVAILAEGPRMGRLDDDLAMTIAPALFAAAMLFLFPGLPNWSP